MTQKIRVVFDTNIWISFLITNKLKLYDLLFSPHLEVLFSKELIDEFSDVVSRRKFRKYFTPRLANIFIERIIENGQAISLKSQVDICRDKSDNYLLSICKDGNAGFLVTGDANLQVIGTYQETTIISPSEFFNQLKKS